MPTLRRLTFRGVITYLDNLVARINTPLLERLTLTLFFEHPVTLVNLTKFIQRTERFGCSVARIIFNNDGASMYTNDYKQQGIGKLSLHVNCEPPNWKMDSVTMAFSALRGVLSVVEELTFDLDEDGMPSEWRNTLDNTLWHELLLPFVSVKNLHIGSCGSSIAFRLARALELKVGGLVLPELQVLQVPLEFFHARNVFFTFIETRKLMGHPVRLLATILPPLRHRPENSRDSNPAGILMRASERSERELKLSAWRGT